MTLCLFLRIELYIKVSLKVKHLIFYKNTLQFALFIINLSRKTLTPTKTVLFFDKNPIFVGNVGIHSILKKKKKSSSSVDHIFCSRFCNLSVLNPRGLDFLCINLRV